MLATLLEYPRRMGRALYRWYRYTRHDVYILRRSEWKLTRHE